MFGGRRLNGDERPAVRHARSVVSFCVFDFASFSPFFRSLRAPPTTLEHLWRALRHLAEIGDRGKRMRNEPEVHDVRSWRSPRSPSRTWPNRSFALQGACDGSGAVGLAEPFRMPSSKNCWNCLAVTRQPEYRDRMIIGLTRRNDVLQTNPARCGVTPP